MKKEESKVPDTLVMTEEYWRNTHLSVVSHFGQIRFRGFRYIVVNKQGKDVWECTHEAIKLGREKAIPEGEPCDLIYDKLQPAYRTLGRDKIITLLEKHKTFDEIMQEAKEVKKNQSLKKKPDENKQMKIDFV